MYLSHFNLRESPFELRIDPKFLWLGEKQKKALETLRYGILYHDGYSVLTGDWGSGKTTIAAALVDFAADIAVVGKMAVSPAGIPDLGESISSAYGITEPFQTQEAFLRRFEIFLYDAFTEGKKAVLIVDEAQRLNHGQLEDLLHLSNVERNGIKLLNLVLVGENEITAVLSKESNQAFQRRVTIHHTLDPLTPEETREYILHRLNVVHCPKELFTPEALQDIHQLSQGNPRSILILCDLALLIAHFENEPIVGRETIQKCRDRLRLPADQAESVGPAAGFFPQPEGEVHGELDKKKIDRAKKRVKVKTRAPSRPMTRVAVGAGLVILIMVLAIPFLRDHQPRQGATQDSVKEEPFREADIHQPAQAPRVAEVVPATEKEQPVTPDTGTYPDPSVQKVDPGRAQGTPVTQKPRARSEKPEVQKPIGRTALIRSPERPAQTDSLPSKTAPKEKETVFDERAEVPSGVQETGLKESFRKPEDVPRRDEKEIDPGRAIDWLLERRLGISTQE